MLRAIQEAIPRNCLKDEVGLDLILESIVLLTIWDNLTQCCINCMTLNNFTSHIHKVLEPETG